MADEIQQPKFQISPLVAVVVVLLLALIISLAIPNPRERKYPDREEVRFWHMWTSDRRHTVQKIADLFNESQDRYEVVPLSIPSKSAGSKFLLGVSGGNPPDCLVHWDPVIPRWAESGLITPLDSLMTKSEWETFKKEAYPIAQKTGIYKGHLYGITIGMNLWAAYYRPSMVRAAGLDPNKFPTSLEELMVWGQKLHKYDKKGKLTRIGFLPKVWTTYIPLFGGSLYDWKNERLTLEDPKNLEALRFLDRTYAKMGRERLLYFEASENQRQDNATWPFLAGTSAIEINGQWKIEELKKYAGNLDYDVAPLPPPKGGKPIAGIGRGNFMLIPSGAKNPQGAMAFIRYWSGISDPEAAAHFYTWGGWLPLNDRVAKAPAFRKYVQENPKFKTFMDMMDSPNLEPLPPVPYQVYLWDRLNRADESVKSGTLSPEAALQRLTLEINEEVQRLKERGDE